MDWVEPRTSCWALIELFRMDATRSLSATDLQRPRRWVGAVLLSWLATAVGCEVLKGTEPIKPTAFKLPPLVTPKEAMQFEIVFVDRLADDSLMGDSLWREIDQIADMPPEQRTRLRKYGWRIGHASSRPPRVLEQVLEVSSGRSEVIDRDRSITRRKVGLLPDSDLPIELTEVLPVLEVPVDRSDEPLRFQNARAVLRVRVEREQDGLARLHFQPEIHHGDALLRPVATQFDWVVRQQPEITPLFDQQFSLTLNTGELAIVSATESDMPNAGRSFFRSIEKSGQMQRLMIVRLVEMQRLKPLYDR